MRAMGSGTAYLTIDMTYNVRGFGEACPFTVSDIVMEVISDKPMLDEVIAQARFGSDCRQQGSNGLRQTSYSTGPY